MAGSESLLSRRFGSGRLRCRCQTACRVSRSWVQVRGLTDTWGSPALPRSPLVLRLPQGRQQDLARARSLERGSREAAGHLNTPSTGPQGQVCPYAWQKARTDPVGSRSSLRRPIAGPEPQQVGMPSRPVRQVVAELEAQRSLQNEAVSMGRGGQAIQQPRQGEADPHQLGRRSAGMHAPMQRGRER